MRVSKFTAAIVAGSLAITASFATPAAAASDGNRLAAILLGAAAVGLAVHTIKKKKKSRAVVGRHNAYRPYEPRVVYHQHRPKTCLRKKYTNHGLETFYSRRCLKQHRHRHNRYDNHGRRHDYDRYNDYSRRDQHYSRDGFYEFQRRANDKK